MTWLRLSRERFSNDIDLRYIFCTEEVWNMYFRIAAEVVLALFAVFGLYSAARLTVQKLFGDKRIFLAIEILTESDARLAEGLIREALGTYYITASSRIAVIVRKELLDGEELVRIIDKYGVECYIIDD